MWWHTFSMCGKQKKRGEEFTLSLGYIVSSRQAWATCDSYLKKKKKSKSQKEKSQQRKDEKGLLKPVWWHSPVIMAFKRLKQEDSSGLHQKFQASLAAMQDCVKATLFGPFVYIKVYNWGWNSLFNTLHSFCYTNLHIPLSHKWPHRTSERWLSLLSHSRDYT